MLTESDVIAAGWAYLKSAGYEIEQRLREPPRGIDTIAVRGNETLRIEAKGATSSRDGSSRHGKRFNSNQALDHIAARVSQHLQETLQSVWSLITAGFPSPPRVTRDRP
jgi:hypothetical protein